jgi:hypothetical protein
MVPVDFHIFEDQVRISLIEAPRKRAVEFINRRGRESFARPYLKAWRITSDNARYCFPILIVQNRLKVTDPDLIGEHSCSSE